MLPFLLAAFNLKAVYWLRLVLHYSRNVHITALSDADTVVVARLRT